MGRHCCTLISRWYGNLTRQRKATSSNPGRRHFFSPDSTVEYIFCGTFGSCYNREKVFWAVSPSTFHFISSLKTATELLLLFECARCVTDEERAPPPMLLGTVFPNTSVPREGVCSIVRHTYGPFSRDLNTPPAPRHPQRSMAPFFSLFLRQSMLQQIGLHFTEILSNTV